VIAILVGAEVDIEDLADALDAHHLSHRLAAGVDGNHVVARVDQIPHSAAPEESASAAAFSAATGGTTNRRFSGAKIYLPRRTTSSLSAPASSRGCVSSWRKDARRTRGRIGAARRAQ